MHMAESLTILVKEIKKCSLCLQHLPHGVNPVLQISSSAKIIIAGQAPGLKVHQSGIPFDDKSGERLRQWLGIDAQTFYDDEQVAILPMAFCYPGKGKTGDLPPRPECAKTWRSKLLQHLPNIQLIITIGSYAQNWHLPEKKEKTLTETVKNWQFYLNNSAPAILPIPHPSPRNNIWLKKNAWFEKEVVPALQDQIENILYK